MYTGHKHYQCNQVMGLSLTWKCLNGNHMNAYRTLAHNMISFARLKNDNTESAARVQTAAPPPKRAAVNNDRHWTIFCLFGSFLRESSRLTKSLWSRPRLPKMKTKSLHTHTHTHTLVWTIVSLRLLKSFSQMRWMLPVDQQWFYLILLTCVPALCVKTGFNSTFT